MTRKFVPVGEKRIRPIFDLQKAREDAGVSLNDAAQASRIGRATLARIERGETPSLVNAMLLARFYELPIEAIWDVEE